jgi:hypothetical protein
MGKSFENIKKDADSNDYEFIATALNLSVETIRKVVSQHRKDKHNIHEAFSILHDSKRQSLAKARAKIIKLKEKSSNSITINNTDPDGTEN